MRYTFIKLRFAIRIWALYFRYRIAGGKNKKVIEKLNETYMRYFYFLENTADPNTDKGKEQLWRAKALREELYYEGENFWNRG